MQRVQRGNMCQPFPLRCHPGLIVTSCADRKRRRKRLCALIQDKESKAATHAPMKHHPLLPWCRKDIQFTLCKFVPTLQMLPPVWLPACHSRKSTRKNRADCRGSRLKYKCGIESNKLPANVHARGRSPSKQTAHV